MSQSPCPRQFPDSTEGAQRLSRPRRQSRRLTGFFHFRRVLPREAACEASRPSKPWLWPLNLRCSRRREAFLQGAPKMKTCWRRSPLLQIFRPASDELKLKANFGQIGSRSQEGLRLCASCSRAITTIWDLLWREPIDLFDRGRNCG